MPKRSLLFWSNLKEKKTKQKHNKKTETFASQASPEKMLFFCMTMSSLILPHIQQNLLTPSNGNFYYKPSREVYEEETYKFAFNNRIF